MADPYASQVALYMGFNYPKPISGSLTVIPVFTNEIDGRLFTVRNDRTTGIDYTLLSPSSLIANFVANAIDLADDGTLSATATNPLTVEFYVYRTTGTATFQLGKSGDAAGSCENWKILVNADGNVVVSAGITDLSTGTAVGSGTSNAAIAATTKTHVAVTIDGVNCTIFLNGTLDRTFTFTDSPADAAPGPFYVGIEPDDTNTVTGCLIDDLQITRAIRYTSSFTPTDYGSNYYPVSPYETAGGTIVAQPVPHELCTDIKTLTIANSNTLVIPAAVTSQALNTGPANLTQVGFTGINVHNGAATLATGHSLIITNRLLVLENDTVTALPKLT